MKFFVITSLLSLAAAAPSTTQEQLRVPIGDIIAQNITTYASDPLFPKLEEFLSKNKHVGFLSGGATVPELLDLIHCDFSGCLWESSMSLDAETVAQLEGAMELETRSPLVSRTDANQLAPYTHWKTYLSGVAGGIEHYTTWNLKCGRLSYRGTGTVLSTSSIKPASSNDIATSVTVHEVEIKARTYVLEQQFACSWFGNKCCVSKHRVTSYGAILLDKKTTWECVSGSNASPCSG